MTTEVTGVNSYGAKALRPLAQVPAGPLAQIPDPEAFFTQLGETAATEIDQIADALAQTTAAGRGVPGGAGAAGDRAEDGRDAGHPGDAPGRPGGSGENRSAAGLTVFTPGSDGDLAPSGVVARLEANLAAIKVVKALQAETRAATPAEQEILARWSGWGAVAAVFEEKPDESRAFTQGRQQLKTLLTDKEYAAARRNTINAHYTGTALAQAMWDGLAAFGFARRAGPGARMRVGNVHRAGTAGNGDGRHRAGPGHRACRRRAVPARADPQRETSPTPSCRRARSTRRSGTCRSARSI